MEKVKWLFMLLIASIMISCNSSDDQSSNMIASYSSILSCEPSEVYQILSKQSAADIEMLYFQKVYLDNEFHEHEDSMLVFMGLKNGHLWLEGYKSNRKDWLDSPVTSDEIKTMTYTKAVSWTDNAVFDKEWRYKDYDGNLHVGTVTSFSDISLLINNSIPVIEYNVFAKENEKDRTFDMRCVTFGLSGKTIKNLSEYDTNLIKWYGDYLFIGDDCYSMDGEYQYTSFSGNIVSYYVGVSRECGIRKNDLMKVDLSQYGPTKWYIDNSQIAQKLNLKLGEKDYLRVNLKSKESENVYVYEVKVIYEDLNKDTETYEVRVDIDNGTLL